MIVAPIFMLGEYVRDTESINSVFEIVGIHTDLLITKEEDAIEESVMYSLMDVRQKKRLTTFVEEDRLLLTDLEDARNYSSNKPLKDIMELDELALLDVEPILDDYYGEAEHLIGVSHGEDISPSVDDLLDDYNDHLTLIEMMGDEDGYYRGKLKAIENELKTKRHSK